VEYLGITDLFIETRHYAGAGTDWVLAPVTDAGQAVVPARERRELERLDAAGIDFLLIFIADEVPKQRIAHLPAPQPGRYAVLHPKTGNELAGPIPGPHQSVLMASRLSQASQRILNGVASTGRAIGMPAATALAGRSRHSQCSPRSTRSSSERRLTLNALAELVPMLASNLSRIELGSQGPPPDETIERIARALAAEPSELLRAAGRYTSGQTFEETVLARLDALGRDLRTVRDDVGQIKTAVGSPEKR
jgi:hypothetical protein